ncbi:MAG: serine/threonine protein kinase [Deltaproteobacteria bacterium]|nr:MAG: serine/threonine protein kinase [Deltaproteobacteria bacterium]
MDRRDGPGMTTDAAPPSPAELEPALAPGAVIAGRYRLEARLGGGGGGTVWRCRDEQLGAVVALKIVAPGGDVERWRREVAMARRIADRNVCRVHDLGETDELRFVTMELAAEASALFAQIAAGAAAIHAAGVVHRDLKPENVVVATDGRAVIVDFGLAREPRSAGATVTSAGVAIGTPRYMSPEQAAGEAVDARTDVWALGLIGHELLAGALPASDPLGRRIDPAVDERLPGAAAVLRRCLALDLDQRYRDARELYAQESAGGRAGGSGSLRRSWRSRRLARPWSRCSSARRPSAPRRLPPHRLPPRRAAATSSCFRSSPRRAGRATHRSRSRWRATASASRTPRPAATCRFARSRRPAHRPRSTSGRCRSTSGRRAAMARAWSPCGAPAGSATARSA